MSASLPVFSVDELPEGGEAILDGPEGRHASTVRRLRPGTGLLLSDGRGGLARCEVTATEKDVLRLVVDRTWHVPAPELRVRLVQALVKGERGELAVELATEAGVDSVTPWRAGRSVARWDDGARGAKALARWRTTVAQAAKQARRPWTPEVDEPCDTRGVAGIVAGSDAAVVLHEGAEASLGAVALPDSGELTVVVGPEGGISDEELAALRTAGAVPVRLGPEVLRASTAGAVALGALGILAGRWQADD